MKVLCYVDGQAQAGDSYDDMKPATAAALFVEEWEQNGAPEDWRNVVVEPLDEEAGAMPGWTTRPDGARVRLFRVRVSVDEVQSFDTVPS